MSRLVSRVRAVQEETGLKGVVGPTFTWRFGLVRNDTTDKVRMSRFQGGHEFVQLLLWGTGEVCGVGRGETFVISTCSIGDRAKEMCNLDI